MSKQMQHTCDKCGHVQYTMPPGKGTEEEKQAFNNGKLRFFFHVGIYCGSDDPTPYSGQSVNRAYLTHVKPIQYWCGQCTTAHGIRLPQHAEPAPTQKNSTLEEMIQEIVGEAVNNELDNRR